MHHDIDTFATETTVSDNFTASALEHVMLLHPTGRPGLVAIAKSDLLAENQKERWVQRSFRVLELPEIVVRYAGQENVYISMQRFRSFNRKIENLLELSAVYSDIDFYNVPELRDANPDYVVAYVLSVLEEAHLPHPSLIVSTGRGLALIWLHKPVPAAVLPRWNAMQNTIYKALQRVGADAKAKDAARMFRLVGSIHGASGEVVRIIGGDKAVWGFDELANEILPYSRDEVTKFHDLRVQKALRRKKSKEKREDGDKKSNLRGYSRVTLAQARLRDLQTLRERRYGAGVPMDDFRDRWLFIATCEIAYLADPVVLKDEVKRLARDIGYPERTAVSNMSETINRAVRAARGEKITYAGNKIDPRYRYSNKQIIGELEITPEEEKIMETIYGKKEKRKRDVERKRKMRREAGMIDREAAAVKNRARVLTQTLRGKSVAEIAKALKLSESRVKQIRRELRRAGELEGQHQGSVMNVHEEGAG